jgi:hypothetical protein
MGTLYLEVSDMAKHNGVAVKVVATVNGVGLVRQTMRVDGLTTAEMRVCSGTLMGPALSVATLDEAGVRAALGRALGAAARTAEFRATSEGRS